MRAMAGMVMLTAALTTCDPGSPVASEIDSARAAGDGSGELAWDLVRAAGPGNVVVSPVSVWEALAMTHQGARGKTAAEIAEVLGMQDDRPAIAAAAAALRAALAEAKGESIRLDMANRLWLERGRPMEEEFTTAIATRFGATAGEVPFSSSPETARDEINAWVAGQTAHKIPELLEAGVITPLTRLVLTNAIFMKAPWASPFQKSATKSEAFRLASGESVDVPFMHGSDLLVAGRVAAGDEAATVCEIPYAGRRLSMVVVVPDVVDGLDEVLGELDGDWRTKWNGAGDGDVRPRRVALSLPKWTARRPLGLSGALKSLGMKQAFEAEGADLSGIDGTRDLFVSDVVHEAFVEVSEEGTEAAAATGVVIGVRSMPPQPEEPFVVKADRPFAWAIVERDTGAILFAGTVTDPRD